MQMFLVHNIDKAYRCWVEIGKVVRTTGKYSKTPVIDNLNLLDSGNARKYNNLFSL